ncbi:hypothetical protein DSO57_1029129, partial [Entomophthora muscae]
MQRDSYLQQLLHKDLSEETSAVGQCYARICLRVKIAGNKKPAVLGTTPRPTPSGQFNRLNTDLVGGTKAIAKSIKTLLLTRTPWLAGIRRQDWEWTTGRTAPTDILSPGESSGFYLQVVSRVPLTISILWAEPAATREFSEGRQIFDLNKAKEKSNLL